MDDEMGAYHLLPVGTRVRVTPIWNGETARPSWVKEPYTGIIRGYGSFNTKYRVAEEISSGEYRDEIPSMLSTPWHEWPHIEEVERLG